MNAVRNSTHNRIRLRMDESLNHPLWMQVKGGIHGHISMSLQDKINDQIDSPCHSSIFSCIARFIYNHFPVR